MSHYRPSRLMKHRRQVIARFRQGLSMQAIGKLFGCGDTAVRVFLLSQIPAEYKATQLKRYGPNRLRPHKSKEDVGDPMQCTGIPETCMCHFCVKRRQITVEFDGQRTKWKYRAQPAGILTGR